MSTESPTPTALMPRVDAVAGGRDEGGVDETRSLPVRRGCRAPGWSPAAAEQRTRAAWSSDPSLVPAARDRAAGIESP